MIQSGEGFTVNDLRKAVAHADYDVRKKLQKWGIAYDFRRRNKSSFIPVTSLVNFIVQLGGFIHVFSQQVYAIAVILSIHEQLQGQFIF